MSCREAGRKYGISAPRVHQLAPGKIINMSEERLAAVRDMIESVGVAAAARRLGVHPSSLHVLVDVFGGPARRPGNHKPAARVEKLRRRIRAMLEEGLSSATIVRRLGIARDDIYRLCPGAIRAAAAMRADRRTAS